jgi:hypothetical protein
MAPLHRGILEAIGHTPLVGLRRLPPTADPMPAALTLHTAYGYGFTGT